MNLAALWSLPVVFMVTNNQFGMGTALERHSAVTDLMRKGEGFGVPGMRCDGMDVMDTYNVTTEALRIAREERRPVLVEAVTYRFRGPLDGRPRGVPHEGAGRPVAQARPARGVRRPARRGRHPRRRRARADGPRDDRARRRAPSRSPTPRPTRRPTTSTTTSTCSATRCAAGTPSTSARRPRTAARTSAGWTAPTCRARPSTATPARTRRTPPRPPSEKSDVARDGGHALPGGAQRGAARGDGARRERHAHGRGHRRLQRRLQGDRGPARRVRREARARHADLREHDRRHGRRRRDDRPAPRRRAHDDQLLAAGDGPDRQPRGDDPLHVRRPGQGAARRAHAAGRRPPARPDALALLGGALPPRARACSSPCRRPPPTPRAC